jgi:hypothetical protein
MIVSSEMKLSQNQWALPRKKEVACCLLCVCLSGEPPRIYRSYVSTYNGLLLCSLIESRQLQIFSLSYQDHSYMYI